MELEDQLMASILGSIDNSCSISPMKRKGSPAKAIKQLSPTKAAIDMLLEGANGWDWDDMEKEATVSFHDAFVVDYL